MISIFLFSMIAFATETNTSVSTETETNTWKRVDKSLSEGVKTAKKKFMDADDGKKKEAPKKSDGELDKVADSLNEAWDNTLKGVGKILKTQETNSKTTTVTVTATQTQTQTSSISSSHK